VRRQQQQIKELTTVVREQLHQIQTLTETLGEMVREKDGGFEGGREGGRDGGVGREERMPWGGGEYRY
jgi:hypothetical protein